VTERNAVEMIVVAMMIVGAALAEEKTIAVARAEGAQEVTIVARTVLRRTALVVAVTMVGAAGKVHRRIVVAVARGPRLLGMEAAVLAAVVLVIVGTMTIAALEEIVIEDAVPSDMLLALLVAAPAQSAIVNFIVGTGIADTVVRLGLVNNVDSFVRCLWSEERYYEYD
jgi:hypothetical protein